MKKAVVLILALLVMTMNLALVVNAAPDSFVSSPSANPAPEIVEGKNTLVITAYADRTDLPEEKKQELEKAYNDIVSAEKLTEVIPALEQISQNLGIEEEALAVADLFDIHDTDASGAGANGHYDITLESDALKNFVALLHLKNGQWEVVENAKVTNNGTHLEFDVMDFSPFAIVVNTDAEEPATGDASNVVLYSALAVVSAAVVVFLCVKLKKQKAN